MIICNFNSTTKFNFTLLSTTVFNLHHLKDVTAYLNITQKNPPPYLGSSCFKVKQNKLIYNVCVSTFLLENERCRFNRLAKAVILINVDPVTELKIHMRKVRKEKLNKRTLKITDEN